MYIVYMLAQALGFMFIVTGISTLNRTTMSAVIREFENNRAFVWLGGLVALGIGLIVLSLYSLWSWEWPVLITIVGWLSLLKGVVLLVRPEQALGWYKSWNMSRMLPYAGWMIIFLGVVLLYYGVV